MNYLKLFNVLLYVAITASLLVAIPSVGYAKKDKDEKVTVSDVKKSIVRSFDMIGQYTLEQRDDALREADKVIKQLDKKMNRVEVKLEGKWQDMNAEARKEYTELKSSIRKQRNSVAEWYGGMQHSSENAWQKVKKGFKRSYDELEKALDDAAKEFED